MAKAKGKRVLGRGLSALLSDSKDDGKLTLDVNSSKIAGRIIEISLDEIEVNPFQPRTSFNEETLTELASSINKLGVIQPITVRKLGSNKYQLVSGERRYRASKLINQASIPAYIRTANDQESLEMALVENIQRQDLDPIEIALSYQRLIYDIKLTQEQMSQRVGKKRSTISNYLRLLKLDPIIQTGIRDGFISMGHGKAMINIENPSEQLDIYEKIIANGLSVRETEKLVKDKKLPSKHSRNRNKTLPSFLKQGEKELTTYLGSKIIVNTSKGEKGKIIIPFNSKEDFNRIKKLLHRAK